MKNKIIAIDCDDTIINSSKVWIDLTYLTLKELKIEPLTDNPKNYKDLFIQDKTSKEYKKIIKTRKKYNKKYLNMYIATKNAKQVIDKFKSMGFKIYILSARDYKHWGLKLKKLTKKILEDNKIYFDKIILNCKNKAKFCKKHNIALLIDNSLNHCKACKEMGINAICYNEIQQKPKDENLIYSDNWKKVFDKSIQILC